MLPKFELVPMQIYFRVLAKVRRPSRRLAASTPRSCAEQDDVGRLAGHVGRAVDRDPDVGRVQAGRVVDPVAEKADHVPARACSARMMRFFWSGVDAANRVGPCDHARQRGVGKPAISSPVSMPVTRTPSASTSVRLPARCRR